MQHLEQVDREPIMWTFILFSACTTVTSQDPSDGAQETVSLPAPSSREGSASSSEGSTADLTEGVDLDAMNLDPWEQGLLTEVVESVRKGVVLYGDDGFGLCAPDEKKRCETYIGAEHATLPYGDYIVRAELQAPAHGTGWQVEYVRECTVHPQDGRAPETKPKTWKRGVKYKNTRAYPQRFPNVKSPSPFGREECSISLYSLRNDDQGKTLIAQGSFIIPASGAEAPDYAAYIAQYQIPEESDSSEGAQ